MHSGPNDTKRRYNGLVKQAKFRVGLIQMACSLDPNENLAKAEWRIREAAAKDAQIICLQELFRSQYFCQTEDLATFDLAEPIPGPTTESFTKLAAELNVVIVASVFERRMAGVYHNTAVVIDAGGALLGLYRKMHIPDDPRFYEKYYFTPADPAVPGRRDFVEAAPALAADPRFRLPPASALLLRQQGDGVLSPPSGQTAPRGAPASASPPCATPSPPA